MIREESQIDSPFGSRYEKYFENGDPNPDGDILGGGVGLPAQRNNWWDTREMWTYPYYSLNVMSGEGVGSYRNESGFKCELHPGSFFFTFPRCKQHYSPAIGGVWGELYVSFAGAIFDAVRGQTFTPEKPVWQLVNPDPWIKRLQTLLQEPAPLTSTGNLRRAVQFLGYILAMMEEADPIQAIEPTRDWFTQACKMLTNDLHHKVNLQDIAEEFGMSYNTFRIYFTRRAGMPPLHYREQIRIKVACDNLTNNTHKSCKEIAFNLGYSDLQQFSAQFKKHTGFAPNQYRKNQVGTHSNKSQQNSQQK